MIDIESHFLLFMKFIANVYNLVKLIKINKSVFRPVYPYPKY